MADYLHVNEKASIDVKCICGRTVSFRIQSISNAIRCSCGVIVLRKSVMKRESIENKGNKKVENSS